MSPFEEKFEAELIQLANNARAASSFVYTELTLHHFFGGDNDILDRINPLAGFWNSVLASLQAAGFIALGRLYDQGTRDHTIRSILKFINDYRGIFQRDALRKRKINAGMSPEYALQFVADASEPTDETFANLKDEFERHRQLYDAKVKTIRDEVFAHAGRITKQELEARFTKVFIRELEDMVVFPLRLHRALFGLYENGTAAIAEPPPTKLSEILSILPGHRTVTWEHMHTVKDVAELAVWLKSVPAPAKQINNEAILRMVRAIELAGIGLKESDY